MWDQLDVTTFEHAIQLALQFSDRIEYALLVLEDADLDFIDVVNLHIVLKKVLAILTTLVAEQIDRALKGRDLLVYLTKTLIDIGYAFVELALQFLELIMPFVLGIEEHLLQLADICLDAGK
ncbi:MAG: hypothetical protein CMH16_28775 [Methylobacterium sp.]|nr:hypothetical protein [Methylobacterium sp.]